MDKILRALIACGLAGGLSFVWAAILPPGMAAVVAFVVAAGLGAFAVSGAAPNVLPVYRVDVRADDYEREPPPNFPTIGGTYVHTPRWNDPDIKHLRGVAWHDAEIPPKRHECWPQTDGWIGLDQTQRCACGALRSTRYGNAWMERNSRKPKVVA